MCPAPVCELFGRLNAEKDRKFLPENSVRTDLILYFPKSDRFIQDEIQASPESYRFIQDEFSHVLYVCC